MALQEVGGIDDIGTLVAELRDAFLLDEPVMVTFPLPRTVVAYSRSRLRDYIPADAQSRFVRWCVRVSAQIDADINADTARKIGIVETRIPDFERAITYASEHGALEDAMRIGAALWYYYWTTSQAGRGLAVLRTLIERYEMQREVVAPDVAAEAYARAASLAYNSSGVSLRLAARWTDRAVELFQTAEQPSRVLRAMIPGCSIFFELGDIERAKVMAQASLELAREIGDPSPVGIIYNNLGTIYEEVGEFDRALEAYRSAAALFTVSTPTVVRAYTLANIGTVQAKAGQAREALSVLRSALRCAREAKAEAAVILALREIGETYVVLGRPGRAAYLAVLALHRAESLEATFDIIAAAETLAHAVVEVAPEASAALYGAVDALRLRTDRPRRPPAQRRRSDDLQRIALAIGLARLEHLRLDGIAHGLRFGVRLWKEKSESNVKKRS
jgi:tetratricopeptide (TPR) repeat protein